MNTLATAFCLVTLWCSNPHTVTFSSVTYDGKAVYHLKYEAIRGH